MKNLLKNNNQGFTLVELLVAVAIIAVVTVPVFHVFVIGANTSKKAQTYGNVTEAMENTIEVIKASSVTELDTTLQRIGTVTPPDKLPGSEALGDDDQEFIFRIDDVDVNSQIGTIILTLNASTANDTLLGTINSATLATFVDPYAQGFQSADQYTDPDQIAMKELKSQAKDIIYDEFDGLIVTDSKINLTGRTIQLDFSSSDDYPVLLHATYHHFGDFTYEGRTFPVQYSSQEGERIEVKPDSVPSTDLDEYSVFFAYTPIYFSSFGGSDPNRAGEKVVMNNPENLPIDLFLVKQFRDNTFKPTDWDSVAGEPMYSCKLELYEASGAVPTDRKSHLELYTNAKRNLNNGDTLTGSFPMTHFQNNSPVNFNLEFSENLAKVDRLARFYEVTVDVYQDNHDGSQTKIATMATYKLE